MLFKTNNHAFRHLFISRMISVFADSVMFFSLLKWLENESESNHAFTIFYIAFYLPIALFSLPVGAWISTQTLQKVMFYSNLVQASVLIIFVCIHSIISYQWVYLLLVINSILSLFFLPANQSLIPHILNENERSKGNSILQIGYTGVKIAGQIVTAFLIKLSLEPILLLTISASLAGLSLLFIRKIKPYVKQETSLAHSQWQLMKSGVRYIMDIPALKFLFLFLTFAMLLVTTIDLILLSFLTEVLHTGVENLSFIGTASLCGIAVGAVLAPTLYDKLAKKWLFLSPIFIIAVGIGGLYFLTSWIIILPLFFLQGIAIGCFNVTFVTYLQNAITEEHYTRTFSLYNMITSSMALPGVIIIGYLLKIVGVQQTIIIISGCLILLVLIGAIYSPSLENQKHRECRNL